MSKQTAPVVSEYLTVAETASIIRVTGRTLRRWREVRQGPPCARVGERRVLYRRADLDAWLAARMVGASR
jgi:excisionase family DNA binding protein